MAGGGAEAAGSERGGVRPVAKVHSRPCEAPLRAAEASSSRGADPPRLPPPRAFYRRRHVAARRTHVGRRCYLLAQTHLQTFPPPKEAVFQLLKPIIPPSFASFSARVKRSAVTSRPFCAYLRVFGDFTAQINRISLRRSEISGESTFHLK